MSLPRLRAASCAAAAAAAIGYGAYTLSAAPGPDRLERWHAKWASKQTRWHLQQEHPLLVRYRADLFGPQPRHDSPSPKAARSNVLFPLCGASVDLAALALRGYRVVGVEGVEAAVDALLETFGDKVEQAPPSVSGSLRLRTAVAPGEAGSDAPAVLRAVEGDFLHLSPSAADALGLPRFDAAFDRGALVAVLPEDREAYVATLAGLMAPEGRVLLVTARPAREGMDGAVAAMHPASRRLCRWSTTASPALRTKCERRTCASSSRPPLRCGRCSARTGWARSRTGGSEGAHASRRRRTSSRAIEQGSGLESNRNSGARDLPRCFVMRL